MEDVGEQNHGYMFVGICVCVCVCVSVCVTELYSSLLLWIMVITEEGHDFPGHLLISGTECVCLCRFENCVCVCVCGYVCVCAAASML